MPKITADRVDVVRHNGFNGHYYARGARHFALASARSFAHLFQFGMLRLVFGFTQVFFVSFAMSLSGCW